MEMLRLMVEGVTGIVYRVTHLRKDLLKEQAPRVLRIEYCSPNDLRVGYPAGYPKDLVLEERQVRVIRLQDCQVLEQHNPQMLQDSEEALSSNIVLIQPSLLPCLPQGALAEALLPLLHL
jgi:hypothetical protein